MSNDYIVSSLPALQFGDKPMITWKKFTEMCGGEDEIRGTLAACDWNDLETQLRNAIAEARNGADFKRAAEGCSLYWKNRILACFQETDVAKRDEAIDRVFWDAAAELTPPASPLGKGALATYAVRLKIALKRSTISKEAGNVAFDKLTSATKIEF